MSDASYFLIRSAIDRAEWRTPISELDELQKRLLYLIADESAQGHLVRMSQLKEQRELGTLPTILGRLNGMIEAGLLERLPDPNDGRSHYLAPTQKAKRAIARISRDVEHSGLFRKTAAAGKRERRSPRAGNGTRS